MIYWTYGIIDPRSGLFVYIGQTSDLERRTRQHLATHRVKKEKHPPGSIKAWLCQAHRTGLVPVILPLEAVQSEEESLISESRWVERLGRIAGHPLRNLWDEHRELIDGQNTGTYDALIFAKDGPPRKIGQMVPNRSKTGFAFELPDGAELKGPVRVDFLPERSKDEE